MCVYGYAAVEISIHRFVSALRFAAGQPAAASASGGADGIECTREAILSSPGCFFCYSVCFFLFHFKSCLE